MSETHSRHEGYAIGVLADETIPTYRDAEGIVRQHTFVDSAPQWAGPRASWPAQPPAQLIPACLCGWRGPRLPYSPDSPDTTTSPTLRQLWRDHLQRTQPAPS